MRTLLTVMLFSLIIYAAPNTTRGKNAESLRSFSFSLAGMERPRSIHIWQDDNGQVLLELEGV